MSERAKWLIHRIAHRNRRIEAGCCDVYDHCACFVDAAAIISGEY